MSKKILTILLIAIIIALPLQAQVEVVEYDSKFVKVYSLAKQQFNTIELVSSGNQIYMRLDDILKFTGFKSSYAIKDEAFELSRGGKNVTIDYNESKISYGSIEDEIAEKIVWKESVWLPMYPTIKYLNTVIEIEPEGNFIIIINAEYTLLEFIAMFNELVESEVCEIWDYYVNEDLYVKSLLNIAIILDVLGKGKFTAITTGSYDSDYYRDILLKALSEDNFKLKSKIHDDPAPRLADDTLSAIIRTKWFEKLDPVDQLEFIEFKSFSTTAQLTKKMLDYLDFYDAVEKINSINVELLRDTIQYMSYDNQLKNSRLYNEADFIINIFDEEAENLKLKDSAQFLAETATDAGISFFAGPIGLGANAVNFLYDRLGVAPSNTIEDFIATIHYADIQTQIYEVHNLIMREILLNSSQINKDRIDALYASALFYIKVREAHDTHVLNASYDNVSAAAMKFSMVSKSELYLDNPSLNDYSDITLEEVAALPEMLVEKDHCTYVAVDVLHLRSGPSTEHEILDRLSYGTRLEVIETEGDWLFVEVLEFWYDKQGWVHGNYVETGFGPFPCNESDHSVTIRNHTVELRMKNTDVTDLLGEPIEIKESEWGNYIYIYPDMELAFFYNKDGLLGTDQDVIERLILIDITVYGNQVSGPRGIQVGDTFESVSSKFPDSENPVEHYAIEYKIDDSYKYYKIMYGNKETLLSAGPPSGITFYNSEQKPLYMWLQNYPESYLSIYFENERVNKIILYLQVM